MTNAADAETAWLTFMNDPASYIDTMRLALMMEGEISAELCDQIKSVPRLRPRLSALIETRMDIPSPVNRTALSDIDAAIASETSSQLLMTVIHAGAVFWSNALANAVRREEVVTLQNLLGEELVQFGIKHRELGAIPQPLEPLDTLRARIEADGWCCYAAWCDAMPDAVSARARLKIPVEVDAGSLSSKISYDSGPAIIRCAASGYE